MISVDGDTSLFGLVVNTELLVSFKLVLTSIVSLINYELTKIFGSSFYICM